MGSCALCQDEVGALQEHTHTHTRPALPGLTAACVSPPCQEGFAPPEDDELEEQQPEDQDEY